MTTAELERLAREIVPPVGATGWRATVLEPHVHAVVPIIDGRLDGKPVWQGAQRDTYRLMDLLEGRPTSRRARDIPAERTPRDEPDRALTEAPDDERASAELAADEETRSAGASSGKDPVRLCAGCDAPLPADARPNRTTHDGACRVRAARRRSAASRGRADAGSPPPDVTVSGARTADPTTRPALEAEPTADTAAIATADPRGLSGSPGPVPPGGPTHPVATQPHAGSPVPGIAGGDQLARPLAVPSG